MAAEDDLNEIRATATETPVFDTVMEDHAEADAYQQELALREQAYAELESQFKRLAADFENFRRRAVSEREDLIKFAGSRVLENLLPVVDNFERALGAMAKASEVSQVQSGIEMIYRQMQDFLTKSGVAPMEAQGKPFDPNFHEAIAQTENPDLPDETVMAEVQKGYLYNGKVLRHAMVQVSRNPGGAPSASGSGDSATPVQNAAANSTTTENPAGESAANKEEHNG
ncbi:heat shock protein GrpE [compost metagenome]